MTGAYRWWEESNPPGPLVLAMTRRHVTPQKLEAVTVYIDKCDLISACGRLQQAAPEHSVVFPAGPQLRQMVDDHLLSKRPDLAALPARCLT